MQDGTIQRRGETEPGRALVPLVRSGTGGPGETPAMTFVAQLIEARERGGSGRRRRATPEQALRRYGFTEALTRARAGSRFERVV